MSEALEITAADAEGIFALDVLSADLDAAEVLLLQVPEIEGQLHHSFAPGLYIRELTIPAGAVILGHAHRGSTLNMMMKGRVVVHDGEGVRRVLVAPYQFVSPPGRKMAYALEETVWVNVFPNPDDETDIDALEDRYTEKSAIWLAHRATHPELAGAAEEISG